MKKTKREYAEAFRTRTCNSRMGEHSTEEVTRNLTVMEMRPPALRWLQV